MCRYNYLNEHHDDILSDSTTKLYAFTVCMIISVWRMIVLIDCQGIYSTVWSVKKHCTLYLFLVSLHLKYHIDKWLIWYSQSKCRLPITKKVHMRKQNTTRKTKWYIYTRYCFALIVQYVLLRLAAVLNFCS